MTQSDTRIRISWLGRLARLQPWYVITRFQNRTTRSAFAFVNGCIAIAVMAVAAIYTNQPLIFPSLGPSAFLFFYQPSSPSSSPRSAILSHATGLLVGWLAFTLFGNETAVGQISAVTLSLGAISALMISLDIAHPPAASTTLLVAMGLMTDPAQFAALMVAVILLTGQAFIINRLCGVAYPIWHARDDQALDGMAVTALCREATPRSHDDAYSDIAGRLAARQDVLPPKR